MTREGTMKRKAKRRTVTLRTQITAARRNVDVWFEDTKYWLTRAAFHNMERRRSLAAGRHYASMLAQSERRLVRLLSGHRLGTRRGA